MSGSAKAFALVPLLVLAGACRSTPSGTAPVTIESAPFDPSLHVDLGTSIRTATGLYYRDVVTGTGPVAAAGQQVDVHYAGSLPNGRQFDATGKDRTFSFRLGAGKVIAGWDQGVAGMRVGGTRQLIVPPQLGYGASGIGPIPPNAILVFTVELVAVR